MTIASTFAFKPTPNKEYGRPKSEIPDQLMVYAAWCDTTFSEEGEADTYWYFLGQNAEGWYCFEDAGGMWSYCVWWGIRTDGQVVVVLESDPEGTPDEAVDDGDEGYVTVANTCAEAMEQCGYDPASIKAAVDALKVAA